MPRWKIRRAVYDVEWKLPAVTDSGFTSLSCLFPWGGGNGSVNFNKSLFSFKSQVTIFIPDLRNARTPLRKGVYVRDPLKKIIDTCSNARFARDAVGCIAPLTSEPRHFQGIPLILDRPVRWTDFPVWFHCFVQWSRHNLLPKEASILHSRVIIGDDRSVFDWTGCWLVRFSLSSVSVYVYFFFK